MKKSSTNMAPPNKSPRVPNTSPQLKQFRIEQANFQGGVHRSNVTVINGQSQQNAQSQKYALMRYQNAHYREHNIMQILQKMLNRRKRYCFQVIKQFYLFPDETISESISIDPYDRLFYHDQYVHTIVKIFQTKELQAKIWAFLNLKAMRLKKQIEQFSKKVSVLRQQKQIAFKSTGFSNIKQYSINVMVKEQFEKNIADQKAKKQQQQEMERRKRQQRRKEIDEQKQKKLRIQKEKAEKRKKQQQQYEKMRKIQQQQAQKRKKMMQLAKQKDLMDRKKSQDMKKSAEKLRILQQQQLREEKRRLQKEKQEKAQARRREKQLEQQQQARKQQQQKNKQQERKRKQQEKKRLDNLERQRQRQRQQQRERQRRLKMDEEQRKRKEKADQEQKQRIKKNSQQRQAKRKQQQNALTNGMGKSALPRQHNFHNKYERQEQKANIRSSTMPYNNANKQMERPSNDKQIYEQVEKSEIMKEFKKQGGGGSIVSVSSTYSKLQQSSKKQIVLGNSAKIDSMGSSSRLLQSKVDSNSKVIANQNATIADGKSNIIRVSAHASATVNGNCSRDNYRRNPQEGSNIKVIYAGASQNPVTTTYRAQNIQRQQEYQGSHRIEQVTQKANFSNFKNMEDLKTKTQIRRPIEIRRPLNYVNSSTERIQAVPYYYTTSYGIIGNSSRVINSSNGSQPSSYLVNTVKGDCTINVNCSHHTHTAQRQRRCEVSINENSSSRQKKSYNCHCNCVKTCSSHHHHHTSISQKKQSQILSSQSSRTIRESSVIKGNRQIKNKVSTEQLYDMGQRIKYLQKLEQAYANALKKQGNLRS